MTTSIERWDTEHGEIETTTQQLRAALRVPKADDAELYRFISICRAQRLNPFLGEVHLVKYDENRPAAYVVGKEAFTQRAERNPDFDGLEAGIIVGRGDSIERTLGTFCLPTDTVLGGWARVFRKNLRVPIEKSVSLAEYTTGRSLWQTKPATMIEKVAIVQALREAFPSALSGLYESGELQQDTPALAVEHRAADTTPATPEPPKLAHKPTQPADSEQWTKFTDFVASELRTLTDVEDIIGVTPSLTTVRYWARSVGAGSMRDACDIMAEQWRNADAAVMEA